ncbi:hypothetical protein GE061_019198 [Apolygus lucorum]|uniref:Uncharacterized protein n=1 Tax=Apolygus lucorum TaxID=248454 RepID=A0A6A4JP36_APOLU|nr:hypothetical protein GE061_019198 [Apolygus lucorum]
MACGGAMPEWSPRRRAGRPTAGQSSRCPPPVPPRDPSTCLTRPPPSARSSRRPPPVPQRDPSTCLTRPPPSTRSTRPPPPPPRLSSLPPPRLNPPRPVMTFSSFGTSDYRTEPSGPYYYEQSYEPYYEEQSYEPYYEEQPSEPFYDTGPPSYEEACRTGDGFMYVPAELLPPPTYEEACRGGNMPPPSYEEIGPPPSYEEACRAGASMANAVPMPPSVCREDGPRRRGR